MEITPAQLIGLLSTAAAILVAVLQAVRTVLLKLREISTELKLNTNKTQAAEDAARAVHIAQLNQAELDFLRRFKSAFDTIAPPEWHEAMKAVLDKRKLRASDSELVKELMERYPHGK